MPEVAVCRSCKLKHLRRDDGVCPRCARPIDAEPVEVSAAEAEAVPRAEIPSERLAVGARIAGLALIINALLVFAERAVLSSGRGPTTTPESPALSGIIDILLGMSLLVGNPKFRGLCIARVVLGGIIFTVIHVAKGNATEAAVQLFISGGLLALLLKNAGRVRIALGSASIAIYVALELVGLVGLRARQTTIADWAPQSVEDGDEIAAGRVSGERYTWHLAPPSRDWKLRKSEAARRKNPNVDRWLFLPSVDAHVAVIVEQVSGASEVDLNVLAPAIVKSAKENLEAFRVIEVKPITARAGQGRLIHAASNQDGQSIEYYFGVFAEGEAVYQLIASAPEAVFKNIQKDLLATIRSFELQ